MLGFTVPIPILISHLSTKLPELRFHALLSDSMRKVRFGRAIMSWGCPNTKSTSPYANPLARKAFGFTMVLGEGAAPKPAFGVVCGI